MKKTIAGIFATFAFAVVAFGQGQVDFRNSGSAPGYGGVARLVYDVDGVTPLSGAGYMAQLYYSTTGIDGVYSSIVDPAVEFRTGAGAGVWNWGTSFSRNIPGTFGGQTVHLMVRAWASASGSTYEAASAAPGGLHGSSGAFAYSLGGTPEGGGLAITAPGMTGFQSFALVPEPSTFALGALGIGALLMVRRRKV